MNHSHCLRMVFSALIFTILFSNISTAQPDTHQSSPDQLTDIELKIYAVEGLMMMNGPD